MLITKEKVKELRDKGLTLQAIANLAGTTIWVLTDKGKDNRKTYRKTAKYKTYQKAYRKTTKYKDYHKTYHKTAKYKTYQKAYQKAYYHRVVKPKRQAK